MANINTTVKSQFKNICFIGLNRVEYFPENSDEAIFADSWRDVTDEHARKHLALCFFAPKDLSGEPVNPYIYLSESDDNIDEQGIVMAEEIFKDIPLLDLCRYYGNAPNTVNILVVADIIFHWDMNGSYIQPTSPTTWIRDLQQIIKGYPRTTTKNLFTNWESEKLISLDVIAHQVHDLPINNDVWINMPTFQAKYGLHVLIFSITIAFMAYFGLYMQSTKLDELGDKIRAVTETTPKGLNYTALEGIMAKQESYMRYRNLMPLIVHDVANAIYSSGLAIKNFKIAPHKKNKPATEFMVNITANPDSYKGWIEQEPMAKAILAQSISISAIRKQPGEKNFNLEGIIKLKPLAKLVQEFQKTLNKNAPTRGIRNKPKAEQTPTHEENIS